MKKRSNICGILLLIFIEILLMGACFRPGTFTTTQDASLKSSGSRLAMYLK
ncbi:hypothetical protein [Pelotalea chapellei]|uniref:Lipoprotein n=1 Tax=Pelotalea chapellei TaxID=44671 RepID=A0ABS5UBX8_9BACT|nr:hypothetical protein [Pelotalea chapellei]MBT1073184.1 hypothetical protein [Pelotalea chapellei]